MPELHESTVRALHRIALEKQVKGRVPGLYAGVVRDGGLVWGEGIGAADVTAPDVPPTVDDQFLVASNSKTFTAVLVMQLRDEGRLVPRGHPRPARRGGHPPGSHDPAGAGPRVGDAARAGRATSGRRCRTRTASELVAGFNEAERVHAPHHLWHYSNLVFSMLGEVVARIDGSEWVRLAQGPDPGPAGDATYDGRAGGPRRHRLLRAAVDRRPGASSRSWTSRRSPRAAGWRAPRATWRAGPPSWLTRSPRCSRPPRSRRCASRRS